MLSLPGSQFLFLSACILSVPLAQLFAAFCVKPKQHRSTPLWMAFLYREGGTRHSVFTVMSWLTWSVSVVFAAPVVTPVVSLAVQPSHAGVLYGAAVACSVVGLVFNIKALLVFELAQGRGGGRSLQTRLLSPDTSLATVLLLGMVLAVMSGTMLAAMDQLPDIPSRLLYCFLSICCAMIAASSTHGLGGHLYHAQLDSEADDGWRFFQPFEGGQVFVASQALGWTLFAMFIACVLKLMQELWKGVGVAMRWWALGTGGIIVVTQLVLGLSLLTFQHRRGRHRIKSTPLAPLIDMLPVVLLYMPIHLVIAVWIVSFTLLPKAVVIIFWATFMGTYYATTSTGNPGHTGCRKWPVVRTWFNRHLPESLKFWVGKVNLIYASENKPDPDKSYIFGYHPHGLYPCGAAFFPLLPGFEVVFPGLTPATLSASVMFFTPLIRDLLSWCGVRDVSRSTFIRALQEDRGVILCPGGQEELVETYRVFREPSELVVCNRHKGFCRIAIEQQASLVPVLSLGEIFTLKNAFNLPKMQRATYRIFGFPIPYLLVGRWGFSPLPKKVPMLFVIGEPIQPPPLDPGSAISLEAVQALHEQYYKSLVELFNRYKAEHPYYSKTDVLLKDGAPKPKEN
ncbi:hypothetical protein BSKO_07159 [Bryopsis sp. KO-2023]|nr:hypothetical protein BSKO_07159 [Bryopsis sp. KO-2023]